MSSLITERTSIDDATKWNTHFSSILASQTKNFQNLQNRVKFKERIFVASVVLTIAIPVITILKAYSVYTVLALFISGWAIALFVTLPSLKSTAKDKKLLEDKLNDTRLLQSITNELQAGKPFSYKAAPSLFKIIVLTVEVKLRSDLLPAELLVVWQMFKEIGELNSSDATPAQKDGRIQDLWLQLLKDLNAETPTSDSCPLIHCRHVTKQT